MDILDIFLDILLKPPQPLIGLFFEHITTGPFNGPLSANFSHGKSSPKTFGHLYFEFFGINVH